MTASDMWHYSWAVARARWYFRHASYLGPRVRLWGRPVVTCQGTMIINERVRLVSTITPLQIASLQGGHLEIGSSTYINFGCSIAATHFIRIGPHCSIGPYVMMMDNDWHRLEPEHRNERPPSEPIILGENVWLGARVIVLRGVSIGDHSVIGAGSVVNRDIPPRSLAAGMPAKVIRSL